MEPVAAPATAAAAAAACASSSSSSSRRNTFVESLQGHPEPQAHDEPEVKPPVRITLDGLQAFERTANMIQKGPATDRGDLDGRNWGGKEKGPNMSK